MTAWMLVVVRNNTGGPRKVSSNPKQMKIVRCSCRGGVPLAEEFSCQESVRTDAESMLSLLGALASADFEHTIFALTSVDRVCFLSQDDYSSPWWIIVTPRHFEEYKIECRIPTESRPWRSATLLSNECSASDACSTIVAALEYCGGWDDSIGDRPIGLAEILAGEMNDFRVKSAARKCGTCRIDWYNMVRKGEKEKVPVTVLFQPSEDQMIGYRHVSPNTTRWGLLSSDEKSEDAWYWRLDDAFFHSKAWPHGPPDDEITYFWNKVAHT